MQIGGRRFSEGTSADREIQRTLMEIALINLMDVISLEDPMLLGLAKHGEIDYEAVVKLAEVLMELIFCNVLHGKLEYVSNPCIS
ncbi:hypothetical protein NC652_004954 [Populus alba x Populus x berolinensis]|nr:hypothetical protein NC652_004954 [Populus alba x Populus x berolinensis]